MTARPMYREVGHRTPQPRPYLWLALQERPRPEPVTHCSVTGRRRLTRREARSRSGWWWPRMRRVHVHHCRACGAWHTTGGQR